MSMAVNHKGIKEGVYFGVIALPQFLILAVVEISTRKEKKPNLEPLLNTGYNRATNHVFIISR